MARTSSQYIIASVDRAIDLLLALEKSADEMGVTELSRILGVQKSTVHSLLQTLLARGFVRQGPGGRYGLGVRLAKLGAICAERLDIRSAALPIMTQLAEETQEVTLLAVLSGDEMVILETVEPQRPFLIIPKFDFSIAVHSTAVGKVLLAHAPPEIARKIIDRGLRRYTAFTLTSLDDLQSELSSVLKNGYAIGCNETIEGITCIAVPVYDVNGNVAAALSVSSASSVLTPSRYEGIIEVLKEKARAISSRLGFVPPNKRGF